MKKLLLIPLFLILLINLAYAEVIITYEFQNKEGNKLDNVDFQAYICNDPACESVTLHAKGNTNAHDANYDIKAWYPTNLPTQYGYALYAFKQGYLAKEAFKIIYGNGESNEVVILEQKEQCSAPIDHIEVLNDVRPNIPLVIGISTSLDADTYSAFHSNSNTPEYIPEDFLEFYSAKTKVTLKIYKQEPTINLNNPLYQIEEILNIFMDSSESIEFTWTPTEEDDYFAKISTEVIDNKCSSSKINEATAYYYVHEDVPSDACYTLINRPGTSNPIDPEVGELITITGTKESYYIDEYQNIEPVNSVVTLTVIHNSKGKVYKETKNIFEFTWTPTEPGDYTIRVDGIANDPICESIENIPSQILTIPLTVYPKSEPEEPVLELSFIPNQVVNEGLTLTFDIMPYNYNGGEEITYTVENLPEGATFEPLTAYTWNAYALIGYRFTWTPDYDTVKHETTILETIKEVITRFFTDGKDCRDDGKCEFYPVFKVSAGNLNDQQEVIISVKDVNRYPHVVNPIGPIIVTEGDLVKVKPSESFSDLDYDKLTYTFTPPLDQDGEWQTEIGDAGEYISTITASDGMAEAIQDILIVVRPIEITENHAPVFIQIDDIIAYIGEEIADKFLKFTIEAFDQDNDSLTYSAIELPVGSIFNADTQEFIWIPTQTGDYTAKFRVEDIHGAFDELTVEIEVKEILPEIYLTLNEIPSQEIMLGQSVTISVSVEYNGEEELTFSVENLPEDATFEDLTFTWIPKEIGNYNIIFKVTDGILTDTEVAIITVTEEPAEIRATKHNIGVQRIIINNLERVEKGKYFPVIIYAKNYAGLTEKNIRITASLPELNQVQYSKSFDLKPKQTKLETMLFRLPVNTDSKEHVLAVTISNNKDKETKYVSIMAE